MPEGLLKKLRLALADNAEPYIHNDEELETVLEIAAGIYSKHRPLKRKGVISVIPSVREYALPEDFQTWLDGLEGCLIFGMTVDLGFEPLMNYEIEYSYLADRELDEIPFSDLPLLIDYGFYFVVDAAVKEAGDISALRLGKGLQIQFDNINELHKAAERRLLNFNEGLQACKGGWV